MSRSLLLVKNLFTRRALLARPLWCYVATTPGTGGGAAPLRLYKVYASRRLGESQRLSPAVSLRAIKHSVVVKTLLGLETETGQNELECTRVSRPWSRNHNTD